MPFKQKGYRPLVRLKPYQSTSQPVTAFGYRPSSIACPSDVTPGAGKSEEMAEVLFGGQAFVSSKVFVTIPPLFNGCSTERVWWLPHHNQEQPLVIT